MSQTATRSRKSRTASGALSQRDVFSRDAVTFDKAFRSAGAIMTGPDGFQWIDETKVPAQLVSAYRQFISYGYANGLM